VLTRFVPSIVTAETPGAGGAIENVRAVVQLRSGTELVVGTDLEGRIAVVEDRTTLAARGRAQLAFHDVAAAGRTIAIDAQELFVFDLQTIEMLPDAPGLNDPLYVYGLLAGPFPVKSAEPRAPVEGQLTVTRADLISGLVAGVAASFAYAPDAGGSRAVHALLPGGRADMIALGRGVVRALPLAPGWLPDCPGPNDLVAAQLLYDVLSALRADMKIDTPLLPVPDRAAFEAQLVAKGWRIEGNEAVRPRASGLLGALRGSDRQTLPRQGSLDDLVAEARALLAKIPEVPTAEAKAIAARLAPPPARPIIPASAPAPALTPSPPVSAARPRVSVPRTEWMKDFVDAHRAPDRRPPKVSTPARAVDKAATPAWMADFAESDADDDE